MRKLKLVLAVVVGMVVVVGLTYLIIGLLRPKVAGIYIETIPLATVYINGEQVGKTPYNHMRTPGEIIIRLIPESFQAPLAPYDAKITMVPGVKTVIKRDFGESVETSSGEIISFEKIDRNQTSLVVISQPDSAEVLIDNKERAFTPHKTSDVLPGEHTLLLKSSGYKERLVNVKTHQGYKLTAVVQLAMAASAEVTPTPTKEEVKPEKPQVEILSTPVGYLRVRNQPSTLANEVGRAEPGKRYDLLSEDEKSGWYKIEYEEGKEGWISNQYAKKIQTGSSLPSGTPTVTPTKAATVTPTKLPTPTYIR